jgi:hypothetical protein
MLLKNCKKNKMVNEEGSCGRALWRYKWVLTLGYWKNLEENASVGPPNAISLSLVPTCTPAAQDWPCDTQCLL